ncbi:hypothetical protein LJC68_09125 [Bacteroidales bacterium OttesenSCG-928-B11]|nr:hypothetical protein [Bacteroidales bacterium OttesenSCG-928-B11]
MSWQYYIVYAIFGLAIIALVWRIITRFRKLRKGENNCDSCSEECALREVKKEKEARGD